MTMRKLATIMISLAFLGTLSSCAGKKVKSGSADGAEFVSDTATIPSIDVTDSTGDEISTEGDIRGTQFVSQSGLKTITFEFDRYGLSEKARDVLKANAEILKSRKEWLAVVEGHCDNRGTVEYNLALGQKRAKEVRDYYVMLGVPESVLGTISYGEEQPACPEETEACWSMNRRAETKVRSR
ncbi:MAG: peptidoglycan-associated lipoprotein [Elusimicrobia bacterium]|nr:MAG: peptidoglycan-associated lipoprotein [Elusimicrobiota bacterium]KAF0153461.1 MAG: peptidoglycan-associated lipoprotein [Elusimicrobiota bacterium]